MDADRDDTDHDTEALCSQARELLGTAASFRVRVLLDMILIELARDAATRISAPRSDSPDES
ncbi:MULTISPECIES: hypothetical protein [Methylobacterium]|uniref:hypothetical protein n=1 Tax=Methylobacterium TaxID=407 RepID=UPI0011CA8C43|nr:MULTISPECIES: hypothetical protein [Methylobacterium]TXN23732.1 hypothetical protein FV217_05950 [Methylobacterium sp. WL9]